MANKRNYKKKVEETKTEVIEEIIPVEVEEKLVEEPTELAKKLMEAFMPGPFTLILKKKNILYLNFFLFLSSKVA